MIDEKKLIDDLLHNDGMDFFVEIKDKSDETIANAFREFYSKLKEGYVALIKSQPSIGWISPKEQLPRPFESVLVHIPCDTPLPTVNQGYFTQDNTFMTLYGDSYTMDEVSFWMPMPKPSRSGKPG